MRRGTIFIVLFILVAAGIVAAGQFLRAQPPLEITIAVDPLAEGWVTEAVKALNDTQPTVNTTRRVQFKVTVIDDLAVWSGDRKWTNDNHPDMWIAASNASVTYVQTNGLPLVIQAASLARTPLVWGGYVSRVTVVTQQSSRDFDWLAVAEAAKAESWQALAANGGQSDWGFIKLGFAQPASKMGGVAALFSAAGSFDKSAALPPNALNAQALRDWLQPVVASKPSFYVRGDTIDAMTRGPSTIEIALLPEAQFLRNLDGLLANDSSRFRFSYPAYQFQLDFPLAYWQDNLTTADANDAALVLRDWLTSATQQDKLATFGLRPVTGEPKPTDDLFAAAIPYGIQLIPTYGEAVQAPALNDVQGLLTWVNSNNR